ncbi:LeuA family protein [Trinickia mobilis]|uniref:LeuA family protein n=1 Tax=Trinickia mobilis TaxID=2816356 RepID=UPI001A8DF275|nr:hypothetical protein [Trinickia mobilis]
MDSQTYSENSVSQQRRHLTFLDTTLRDGEQAPDNAMTPEQKLKLALMLEDAGVETIELGFPASSPADFIATEMISAQLTSSSFATFSRALIKDVETAIKAGGTSDRHLVMMVATGSDLHLKHKRNITRNQGILEVESAVAFARSASIRNIAVGIEDASRADHGYMEMLASAAVDAGANQIIFADTTGYATPDSFYRLIKSARDWVGPTVKLSTHCHNDLGLGLANALAGVNAGADEVQATLGGIGERAGNTSLEQMVALLQYKNEYSVFSNIKLSKLYSAYNCLREIVGLEEQRTQPLFGKHAFSTAAGIHQQGILNNPDTYEYVKPEDVGRMRKLLVSRHSGRSVIRHTLGSMRVEFDESDVDRLYEALICGGHQPTCSELNDLEARIRVEFFGVNV